MPALARKIIICAAADGLILQPFNSKKEQRTIPPVKIKFGDASISSVTLDAVPDTSMPNSSFEAFGIIGLVTVSPFSYLVSITRRQQVALVRGSPIFVVTEVALTPITSHKDATEAITKTALGLRRHTEQAIDGDETASDDELSLPGGNDDVSDEPAGSTAGATEEWSNVASANTSARSSVAEDVIGRKGSYGRFAQRWFSTRGWAADRQRTMGLSQPSSEDLREEAQAPGGKKKPTKKFLDAPTLPEDSAYHAAGGLLFKLLRTAQILFGKSHSFYFSYDYDITRSLANPRSPATALQPLYNHVDPLYFWNKHLMQPFINAGEDSLVLPLMQGFVGQKTFTVDSQPPQVDDGVKDSVELSDFSHKSPSNPASVASSPEAEKANPLASIVDKVIGGEGRPSEKQFDLTVISRRSIKRAGLRYLRRGIDDDGFVANSVESEQILSPSAADPDAKVYSFVQIRGSIPVFFTQTPYSLKPAPVFQHSDEINFQAFKKHFDRLRQKYGLVQVINLVEKHGIEAPIGERYEKLTQKYNGGETVEPESLQSAATTGKEAEAQSVPFEWFDFHAACRGMKFENVSILLQKMGPLLEAMGSTIEQEDHVHEMQKGVLRTNCMDCLDRTNVCQSSFAKYMLEVQLKDMGYDLSVQRDQENSWFNTLWADNGDAISKQYASTAAMKGDYTRTKKRNYRGLMTDASLSLTRFFNGMVNDFFLQTSIDFLLGNVTSMVFEEFEASMMTKDPAISMQKLREQAIELCQKRVVENESEEFIGGWTMLTPHIPDTTKSLPFEEAVLLLTDTALYLCRFDWNLDKVQSFERVDLSHVQKIRFGTYITSTLSASYTDEMRNVGLVVEYKPGSSDITRVNTRSLSSMSSVPAQKAVRNVGGDEVDERQNAAASSSEAAAQVAAPTAGGGGFVGFLARKAVPLPNRKIALKALYSQSSAVDADAPKSTSRLTEIQQVVTIVAEIERMVLKVQKHPPPASGAAAPPQEEGKAGEPEQAGTVSIIEKGDIISLAEAKRGTGVFEQLGHSIKKLVWAS